MPLSRNELRPRAAEFARDWADAAYEKAETQSFYNEFFAIFDVKRRNVARYEEHVKRLDNSDGFIDLFWPKVLLVEQKSAGRSLAAAREQAFGYFDALIESERPRYLLLCDFQHWELLDLDLEEEVRFTLSQLPEYIDRFNFVQGLQKRPFRDQDPVNIEASELIGAVYEGLDATGYRGHALQRLLVRIVFCLFADNTGIFERDSFLRLLEERTSADGADTGMWLNRLFGVLNTPEQERSALLNEDLAAFPYVNGDLFAEQLAPPDFDAELRDSLIRAARFDWSRISPAIFGALFQSVMEPEERRARGAHYTTERNILKVIEPLFLDELRGEFERLKGHRGTRRRAELERFQRRLGELRLFDPACGCGNFLIIAYRELRLLEIEVLRELYPRDGTRALDVSQLSTIDVHQCYGIELLEFPARIAETALWMMDHIMNVRLTDEFGEYFARIPLRASPHIHCADALEIDWSEVLPPEQCSYVFGNPPFGGAKFQSEEQRAQVRRIADLGGSGGSLDYVAAWFLRAGEYVQGGDAQIGFVATNSITQGEQVGQLWPLLFERYGLELSYAHRTFAWGSDARGMAHVHVVVIGLTRSTSARTDKQLYSYSELKGEPAKSVHGTISPYLLDADALKNPHLVVREESRPINGMPQLIIGSKPIDNGHYILKRDERQSILDSCPEAEPYIHPYVGAREFLRGGERYILRLPDAPLHLIRDCVAIRDKVRAVAEFRRDSRSPGTQKLAETPLLYHVNVIPKHSFLVVPKTSSGGREYVPIGWLSPPDVPSDALFVSMRATLAQFALLTSAMHNVWMRAVAGRLKSDYRYSIGIVYNTFPLPDADHEHLLALAPHAQAVLDARAEFPDSSLADLYDDPELMRPALRKAHQQLDRAVDRLYRRAAFRSERERVEHLLARYERMIAPLDAARPKRRRRRAR